MFTIKNIILIIIAAFLAAFAGLALEQMAIAGSFINYLACALIAGIIILLALPLTTQTNTQNSPRKKISKEKTRPAATSEIAGDRETGTVKWFDTNKGYGFITRTAGGDIFVHFRSIKGSGYRSLHEGQSVDFLVTQGDKGPQAEDIHVIRDN